MILLTLLRFVKSVNDARRMQADAQRRNPHLREW
jgi:hypothetical protein